MSVGLLNLGGIAYELRAIVGNVMSIVLTKWTSNHLSCQDLTLRSTQAILFYAVSISVFAASFNFASAAASYITAFADSASVATATFAAGFVVAAAAAIAIFAATYDKYMKTVQRMM